MPLTFIKSYILFPKTDFDNYYGTQRTPAFAIGSFYENDEYKKFMFSSAIPNQDQISEIGYEINYNLKDIEVVISSTFRVQRDTLVAHGILKKPYTDTEDYKEIIKNNILYWRDGKWVNRNGIDKKYSLSL